MVKTKKRKVNRCEKEKPLLTVQGVLRLDKSFIPPKNEDAGTMTIKRSDDAQPEVIKLVPGNSEHDLVEYKLGYEVGPANPFPQNDTEKELFEQKQKVQAEQDSFEQLKKQSELDKMNVKGRLEQPLPSQDWKPPDPDNPDNYYPPEQQAASGPTEDEKIRPPGDDQASDDDDANSSSCQPWGTVIDAAKVPTTMKPLPDELNFGPEMVLSVALQMEEQRRSNVPDPVPHEDSRQPAEGQPESGQQVPDTEAEGEGLEADKAAECQGQVAETTQNEEPEAKGEAAQMYCLDELAMLHQGQDHDLAAPAAGPKISSQTMVQLAKEQPDYDAKALLESYWQFVRQNPRDFNGWTYLLEHVDSIDVMEEIRTAYNAFLPLYPYCYAYWNRYSAAEKRHANWSRALAVLHRGLEAIPLSIDLWISYLEMYHKMYHDLKDFDLLFRQQCERAVQTVGLDFRSDELWERYLEWELERRNVRHVTSIFRMLVATPTRLYNRHWDNFLAHVRDHHPRDILGYDEYEELRRSTCQQLGLVYRPDPIVEPDKPRKVMLPEDRLKAGMKDKIIASVRPLHDSVDAEVEKRLPFEENIKRTYFHVRPLDLKQLKNWERYLDFEIEQGNHQRIVILFERCLIPAAMYEQFWLKYANYLEAVYEKQKLSSDCRLEEPDTQAACAKPDALPTRCSWTLQGWKTSEQQPDGNAPPEEPNQPDVVPSCSDPVAPPPVHALPDHNGAKPGVDLEAIRNVYQRACLVHCTDKALIKLRWATFEEQVGDVPKARAILTELNEKYPMLLECCIQLIDIERRAGNLTLAESLYKKLIKKIPANRQQLRTWLSLKLARFQFKVCGDPDKALLTLRSSLKKDRSHSQIYAQIIEICYHRQPVDLAGFNAAIELCLVSNELSNLQKLKFVKRKVEFMQEFGDVRQYRQACDQLQGYRRTCSAELLAEAKARKQLDKEEMRLSQLEELCAHTRANANLKAKMAENEGRLLCSQCHVSMFPDQSGRYEFEKGTSSGAAAKASAGSLQENYSAKEEDGVMDLMDLVIPAEQEEQIKKTLQEKTKYREVAPTWELCIDTYGYGKRRKIYDPDYEHVEMAKFREYERLESRGYQECLKDSLVERQNLRQLSAPGLGSEHLDATLLGQRASQYTESDYVVPPKVPQLQMKGGLVTPSPDSGSSAPDPPGDSLAAEALKLPAELADLQKSPCVNVPDWFVKEGGELCLSDTENGVSVIRYWPKFLSAKGNHLMFRRLRKYCRWHQKQVQIGGFWKYETRLVAWYGPCDYTYSGLSLEKNLNWAPELLDLLHRLIAMTGHEFNSCFLNLYRHGHDMCGWHSDLHPQLGRNPAIASVSLGTVRAFELRRKTGQANFIRFPLFPGSLLLMEGATQQDWLHCLPRDVSCQQERINLTFRTMYSIGKRIITDSAPPDSSPATS